MNALWPPNNNYYNINNNLPAVPLRVASATIATRRDLCGPLAPKTRHSAQMNRPAGLTLRFNLCPTE